jgi:putative transposase
MTKKRDKNAALKVLRTSLRRHGGTEAIVTDRLASYGAALQTLGAAGKRGTGRWLNYRAENSHQPFRRRERTMLRFRRMRSLQTFAALHGSIHNHFNSERTLVNRQIFKDRRTAALAEWRHLCAT